MNRFVLSLAAGLCLGSLSGSVAHADGPYGSLHVGRWVGGAYTDKSTGEFAYCAATAQPASGVETLMAETVSGRWVLGFRHPSWRFAPGQAVPVDLNLDGQAGYRLDAKALDTLTFSATLPGEAVEQLQKASLMSLVVRGRTIQFQLISMRELMPQIDNCVAKVKTEGIGNAKDFSTPPGAAAAPSPSAASPAASAESPKASEISGTGFVINAAGNILTNNHVIAGCVGDVHGSFSGEAPVTLRVVSKDEKNDLALLQASGPVKDVVAIRGPAIHAGDPVTVIGYPYHGLLTSDFTVSTGIVNSLSGLANDTRYLQISAPVQPGNSGGPLLDSSGRLVGVVAAKINALRIAKLTGDIPENINFAVKIGTVKDFLDNSVVSYTIGDMTAPDLTPAQIANRARSYTLLISCSGKAEEESKK